MEKASKAKIAIVFLLLVLVTILHYTTELGAHNYHLFYQGLYSLAVMLAGFWFGLRGGLITSVAVTFVYLPFIVKGWNGFSPEDFGRLMELVLYNLMAIILGILKERQRAEQKRLREAEGLAAMGKALSAVAHDMKTPLIAIGGFTSMVQREINDLIPCEENFPDFVKQTSERLKIVVKETRRLENMVKDMLDFSRPLELQRAQEDIGQIIEDCISVVKSAASERRVELQQLSYNSRGGIICDSTRLTQVIINLLMNAIQATPEGETVRIARYFRKGKLVIDVEDKGCGIPPDKRERVFQPFVTTKKDGTGLGLPIVKKITEAHGGRIEILNNLEKGITFRVTLPIA